VDFAGQRNSRGTVALTADGKKKLRGRVGTFLQRRRLAVKAARQASASSLALKDPGLPNLHQMRALDKTLLESWSLDLSKFRATKPIKALTGTEERFFSPVKKLRSLPGQGNQPASQPSARPSSPTVTIQSSSHQILVSSTTEAPACKCTIWDH